jgi:hypothetical protein
MLNVGNSDHIVAEMIPLRTQFHFIIGINQLNIYDVVVIKSSRSSQIAKTDNTLSLGSIHCDLTVFSIIY